MGMLLLALDVGGGVSAAGRSRSFRFALRLAWLLVSYLERIGPGAASRPRVLRLLVELEAAAAFAASQGGGVVADKTGDPWAYGGAPSRRPV